MVSQSPLQWPARWPRNQRPEYSSFSPGSIHSESKDVTRQLELMGAENIVINSDMQYRNDGLPFTRQNVHDTGVAVYFTLNGTQQCIPCDRWVKLEENLRAVAKTIDALRGIERWGAKEMVDAAFSGFKALPSGNDTDINVGDKRQDWWDVLGVHPLSSKKEIKAAYLRLVHIHHPDKGGETAMFNKITKAYEEGMEA